MAKEKDEESLVKCIYNDMVFYVPSDVFSIVLLRTQRYSTKKYVRYKEGAELYSMSERKFTDLANNSDAVVHVDKIAQKYDIEDKQLLRSWVDVYVERGASALSSKQISALGPLGEDSNWKMPKWVQKSVCLLRLCGKDIIKIPKNLLPIMWIRRSSVKRSRS